MDGRNRLKRGREKFGGNMNDHLKRLQTIVEQVYESSLNNMEKTVYDWLISRGWDGKDIEEARKLAKGYGIVRYPDLSCEVRKIAENATEAMEQKALYCLHCLFHGYCDKTHCLYYYSNAALEEEIDRAIFDRGFKRFETAAMMLGGIGHIRTSRPLKEVIKASEEKTRRLISPKR